MKTSVKVMGIHTNRVMTLMAPVLEVVQAPALSKGKETSYLIACNQEELPCEAEQQMDEADEADFSAENREDLSALAAAEQWEMYLEIEPKGAGRTYGENGGSASVAVSHWALPHAVQKGETVFVSAGNPIKNPGSLHGMQGCRKKRDGLDIRGPSRVVTVSPIRVFQGCAMDNFRYN
jgi:hypothetical protein